MSRSFQVDRALRQHLLLPALVLLLSACASVPRLDAVPSSLKAAAHPLGTPGLRVYPERVNEPVVDAGSQLDRRLLSRVTDTGDALGSEAPRDLLAISAGGDGGAFAAGLLTGWSQAGTRPRFAVVTGVSVGALIAPFAFLGPRYDHVLHEVALSTGPDKLFRNRGLIVGLLGDGLSSSAPLEGLVARYVTREMLEQVAREYRSGRDLFIMTTDLDAGEPVIWNMGAIAASDAAGSLALFRQVMLASASVPAVVSPVLIDVAAGGQHFRELHVDGGVSHQVFLYDPGVRSPAFRVRQQPRRAFIIMNMRLETESFATPRRTLRIASRAIDMMIQAEAKSDIESMSDALGPLGVELRLAHIGSDFKFPHQRDFDSSYMRELFFYGVKLAASEHAWQAAPAPAQPPPPPAVPSQVVMTLDLGLQSADVVPQ